MNSSENTVKSILHYFHNSLKINYDQEELTQLCNWSFEKIMGYSRVEMLLNAETKVNTAQYHQFIDTVEKLKMHMPIQYIFEETEFYDLKFILNSSVLIPRPETEELVKWMLKDIESISKFDRNAASSASKIKVLDIGTGSGCIAIALQKFGIDVQVTALDISEEALKIAFKNADLNQVPIHFVHCDIEELEKAINATKQVDFFDVLVSNPPYVLNSEKLQMHSNVLNYEPHLALFVDDSEPLRYYKSILNFAKHKLKAGAYIYFEINEAFSNELEVLLNEFGYDEPMVKKDINEKPRMVKAKKHL